jgi:hypothetical protein
MISEPFVSFKQANGSTRVNRPRPTKEYIVRAVDRLYLKRSYCGDLHRFWRLGKLTRATVFFEKLSDEPETGTGNDSSQIRGLTRFWLPHPNPITKATLP